MSSQKNEKKITLSHLLKIKYYLHGTNIPMIHGKNSACGYFSWPCRCRTWEDIDEIIHLVQSLLADGNELIIDWSSGRDSQIKDDAYNAWFTLF